MGRTDHKIFSVLCTLDTDIVCTLCILRAFRARDTSFLLAYTTYVETTHTSYGHMFAIYYLVHNRNYRLHHSMWVEKICCTKSCLTSWATMKGVEQQHSHRGSEDPCFLSSSTPPFVLLFAAFLHFHSCSYFMSGHLMGLKGALR